MEYHVLIKLQIADNKPTNGELFRRRIKVNELE